MDARFQELTERIKNAEFRTTRLSPGYDEKEVDNFLDKLVAILGQSDLPDPQALRSVRFATTRLRPGYAMQDVDRLLREVAEAASQM